MTCADPLTLFCVFVFGAVIGGVVLAVFSRGR